MDSALARLMTARRFAPLFATQFLGAFNDNLLKSALGILVAYRLADRSGLDAGSLAMVPSALFIARISVLRRVGHALRPLRQGADRSMGQNRRDRHHDGRSVGIVARQHAELF